MRIPFTVVPLLCTLVMGCGALTTHTPKMVVEHELTLRYDDGLRVFAGHDPLSAAPTFEGLSHHVRCVPPAETHALEAQRQGRKGEALRIAGIVLGSLGLASLTGLAAYDTEPTAAWASVGIGGALSLIAVGLAGASVTARLAAQGNAVDAVNHFNDAVGSVGGQCR
jgi:hypothetical protein